jgi:alkylated DNA repair dioxygenase AlkB
VFTLPGFVYIPSFVDAAEQGRLVATIDRSPWQSTLRRRIQHYGYRYDYTRKTVGPDAYLGPLPLWADALAIRLHAEGIAPQPLNQVIVNEYLPGQGIAPHVDCVPCFADTIVSLSLNSACVLTMSRPEDGQRVEVLLEPGSLFVLSGPARYDWRHGIAPRMTDRWNGERLTRQRRVSVTFRTVLRDGAGQSSGGRS